MIGPNDTSGAEVALIGRAIQVMSRWLVWFPEDFQEEAMMQKARKLFSVIMERQKSSSVKLNQLIQPMTSHLAAMKKHEIMLEKIAREAKMVRGKLLT